VFSDFKSYTDIRKNYTIDSIKFGRNQSYLQVSNVSAEDIAKLKSRYNFLSVANMNYRLKNLNKPFINFELFDLYNLSSNYEYYLINDYDTYGYYFIGLSRDSNNLFVCENFPELPPALFEKPSFLD